MAITEFEPGPEFNIYAENPVPLQAASTEIALHQVVEIVPVEQNQATLHPVQDFEDFRTELHGLIRGGDYDQKPIEELEEILSELEAIRAAQSTRYGELVRLEATLQREMTWLNGYLIDLHKAIQKKSDKKA